MEQNERIVKQNVGVDVSKNKFRAAFGALMTNQSFKVFASKTFDNTSRGISEFISWMEHWMEKKGDRSKPHSITMEPTGVYHEELAYGLYNKGFRLHLVLPNLAHKYGESMGLKSKTDPLDAKFLGRMGAERKLSIWKPASSQMRKIKWLTRERCQRVNELTRVRNQLHAQEFAYGNIEEREGRYNQLIEFLSSQIKSIEEDIKATIEKDKALHERVKKILTIPGVSLTTAAVMLAETDGFVNIKNIKQLQSYAGYDVQIRQSGKWQGKASISKKGNSQIRGALYMPTFTAIKHCKVIRDFYNRLVEKGKPTMVAHTAAQRKLLTLIYVLWKNNTSFNPEHTFDSNKKENKNKKHTGTKGDNKSMASSAKTVFILDHKKAVDDLSPTALDRHWWLNHRLPSFGSIQI